MPSRRRALTSHQRVFRTLLVLYPPAFRRDYGPAMAQLFADQLRHPRRPGRALAARVWLRTLDDLLSSVPRQRWEAFMDHTGPSTRAAVVGLALTVVAATGMMLALFAQGLMPLAILLAVAAVIAPLAYRRRLRALATRRDGLWYRLLLGGIVLAAGSYLFALAYWSTHDTTSTLMLLAGNAIFLLGTVLALTGAALGLARLGQRSRPS